MSQQITRYDNLDFLALPDCGGLLENGKCGWLKIPACAGVGCASYRKHDTRTQAHERLRSLNETAQEHIAQKYYGGSRPWLGTK